MNDLTGLDWSASQPTPSAKKIPPMNPVSYYPSLRPTPPLSGRSTPSSVQPSENGFKPPPYPNSRSNHTTPASDSFANLVAFSAPQSGSSLKNLSLQEQQKLLQEKREKEERLRKGQSDTGFGTRDKEFLDSLANGRATPDRIAAPPSYAGTDEYGGQKLSNAINKPFAAIGGAPRLHSLKNPENDEGDLLSAFSPLRSLKPLSGGGKVSSNTNGAQYIGTNSKNQGQPGINQSWAI